MSPYRRSKALGCVCVSAFIIMILLCFDLNNEKTKSLSDFLLDKDLAQASGSEQKPKKVGITVVGLEEIEDGTAIFHVELGKSFDATF